MAVNLLKATHTEALAEPRIKVPEDVQRNLAVTSMDALINWARKSAVWPLNFGLACCAFEMIASAMSRFDISRFGMEAFRSSPRQADLLIVSGTVTWKMLSLPKSPEMITDVRAVIVTVIVEVALIPPLEAVMVAAPSPVARTKPSVVTVATRASLELQPTTAPGMGTPFASLTSDDS